MESIPTRSAMQDELLQSFHDMYAQSPSTSDFMERIVRRLAPEYSSDTVRVAILKKFVVGAGDNFKRFHTNQIWEWAKKQLNNAEAVTYINLSEEEKKALLLTKIDDSIFEHSSVEMDYQNDKPAYLLDFAREHVGIYYVLAEAFTEFEQFLLMHATKLSPYWKSWNMFPAVWNQDNLLKAFLESENRNEFCISLQREGNTSLLQWIFALAKDSYGIEQFNPELVSI